MTTTKAKAINIPGFSDIDGDGRVWTLNYRWGLVRNDDGTLSLLDGDGIPAGETLDDDHAAHIIGVVRAARKLDEPQTLELRWNYYASAIR